MNIKEKMIMIFLTMLGHAMCKAEGEYPEEYHTPLRDEYLARGSRPYSSLYAYYPSYKTDEIKKPQASDMFLIEGGVYWPHDPDDSYSSHGSYAGYGNNYAAYRPYNLGGHYSNWRGSISIGSESVASSVPTEDDKDYNDDDESAERGPAARFGVRKRRSPSQEYIMSND